MKYDRGLSYRLVLVLLVGGFSAILLSGCESKAQQGLERPPSPVQVTAAVSQDVPTYLDAIGKTVAREVVAIQPQVSGRIMKIHFTDGGNVKKGDLLFTVDTRPFEANLRQVQANLSRDGALKKQAEANLAREVAQAKLGLAQVERYRALVEQGVVPREQYNNFGRTMTLLRLTWKPLAQQCGARMKRLKWTQRQLKARRCNLVTATFARLLTGVPGSGSWTSVTSLTPGVPAMRVPVTAVQATAVPCW